MSGKPTVCVDLDGVLNEYVGWKGTEDWPPPAEGAREFTAALRERFKVVVFSTRNPIRVARWLDEHAIPYDDATNIKPGAVAYVDDRAVPFTGSFGAALEKVLFFKAHWES